MRVVLGLGLLALAAFCVFGILATFEPTDGSNWGWRVGYGAGLVACTFAAQRLFRKGPRSRSPRGSGDRCGVGPC